MELTEKDVAEITRKAELINKFAEDLTGILCVCPENLTRKTCTKGIFQTMITKFLTDYGTDNT